MSLGKWIKWDPINNLFSYYYLESTEATKAALKFIFIEEDSGKRLAVIFDDSVVFYRITNELLTSRRLGDPIEYEGGEQFQKGIFFKVINSACLKWLTEESGLDLDVQRFIHFSIVSEDDFIDVIATNEPCLEWI